MKLLLHGSHRVVTDKTFIWLFFILSHVILECNYVNKFCIFHYTLYNEVLFQFYNLWQFLFLATR